MTTKAQIVVALAATASGLVSLGLFWLIANPVASNRSIAIGTIIYATAYILAVPRVERHLMKRAGLITDA